MLTGLALLNAQPTDDDVPLPPQPRPSRAEQIAERKLRLGMQATTPGSFLQASYERTKTGLEFKLLDGRLYPTSLQRCGERIAFRLMSRVLRKVANELHSGRLPSDTVRALGAQHLALRFGEALAFEELMFPTLSPSNAAGDARIVLSTILEELAALDAARKTPSATDGDGT